jgi:hypothetical protein
MALNDRLRRLKCSRWVMLASHEVSISSGDGQLQTATTRIGCTTEMIGIAHSVAF